jgi:hypothetical protein
LRQVYLLHLNESVAEVFELLARSVHLLQKVDLHNEGFHLLGGFVQFQLNDLAPPVLQLNRFVGNVEIWRLGAARLTTLKVQFDCVLVLVVRVVFESLNVHLLNED